MHGTRGSKELVRKPPSGRFVVRIEPELHAALRESARRLGVSLNEYCSGKLASPQHALPTSAAEVVKRAVSLFGGDLASVVVFGSWARDEMVEDSDVDVLVVVEAGVTITRDLYRLWDAAPLRWDSHSVEPHFLHLPAAGGRVSGIWAEVAVDGIVLFDRDLRASRRLVEIRRRIASGQIVRRQAHGQPYWVEAA